MEQESPQKDTRNLAKRLNDATAGGLIGVIAGEVKFKDEMVSIAAAVLIGGAVFRRDGVVLGLAVAFVIAVGCALLIRLRKWKVGAAETTKVPSRCGTARGRGTGDEVSHARPP